MISTTCARRIDCELQIGGSDQWGNITAGTDLIRKKLGAASWGLTFPLITKADGTKFGKTEERRRLARPEEDQPVPVLPVLHQHRGQHGAGLPEEVHAPVGRPRSRPWRRGTRRIPAAREAHKALAREVTTLVHGKAALRRRGQGERDHVRRRPGRHHGGAFPGRRRRDPDEDAREVQARGRGDAARSSSSSTAD